MQPRQLAVDEALGARDQIERGGLGRARSRGRDGFAFHNNELASVSHVQMLSAEARNIVANGDDCMT